MRTELKRQLLNAACQPYRAAGHFDYHWARGKLGRDPLFAALLEQGLLQGRKRVLDLGCGRGLLAAWFLAAEQLAGSGNWPAACSVPTGLEFRGMDLQASACAAGNRALQPQHGLRVQLQVGDLCQTALRGSDTITIFDVLHYLSLAQQEQLLDRIRSALGPGGLLLLRVGNARGGWRFRFSRWVDRCVGLAQGLPIRSLCCRNPGEWTGALEKRGFVVQAQSMSKGTPFANVLITARLP